MNQELATATALNIETLSTYLETMGLAQKLNKNEQAQFLQIAQAYGLNPFKREIYATKYGEGQYAQFSIIVGYEVYLKRAERSGKLNGWEAEFRGEGDDLSCVVTIWRKDWDRPLKHEAWYSESVQRTKDGKVTKFWEKRRLMTRKVAISQAFRLAFSDELGGMPYTDDELGVNIQDTTATVTQEAPTSPPTTATVAPDQPAKDQPKYSKLEQAEHMKALTEWQTGIDTLPNLAGSYTSHVDALRNLKGISNEEKKLLFEKFKGMAWDKGFDYNDKAKVFIEAEPVQEVPNEAYSWRQQEY